MAELLKTTKTGQGRASHYHIAYLDDNLQGKLSISAAKHTHDVVYRPSEIGEEGGSFIIYPAEDGHTHELVGYDITLPKEEKEEDSQIVTDLLAEFTDAKKREEASRNAGYESEDMYANKHWDAAKKKELEGKDRAAITVNKIEQKLDNLSGYQRQNRMDIKYLPTENGDGIVADILNIVSKNCLDSCHYQREKTKVFDDAVLVGRGLFNIYEDFDRDIYGKIIIERFKWDECFFAVHEKEDLSDSDWIIKTKWYSKAKVKETFPEEFEKLSPEIKVDERVDVQDLYSGDNYRLFERWKKVYKRVFILVNPEDGFSYNAAGWKKEDMNAVKDMGFKIIPRVVHKMRITKVISSVLISDEYIEEESEDFPIIPLYAKFRNDKFWGKVEGVKDLNRLINKAYSQFVDIINKVANYGWFYDSETFPNKKALAKWIDNASSPGFNQEVSDTNKLPPKAEGVKFPAELVQAIAMFSNDMREVMNINLEMLGENITGQSGVAVRQKIAQQLLGNDFIFDNLSFAEAKIGKILVKKIQKLYTPEKILRIIKNQSIKEDVEIAGQPLESYNEDDILRLLQTSDLAEYDVIVSESANSPSVMMGNFLLLMELAGKGVDIPPQAIIEYAPIPNKEKILRMIAEQMQIQQERDNQKYNTEIQKTLISKGMSGQTGA